MNPCEVKKALELSEELFDAFFVAEQLSSDDLDFAKFARTIIKKVPKKDRDIAFLALVLYIKSGK